MSFENEPERENADNQQVNSPGAPSATGPQAAVNPAVADFRQETMTGSQHEVLLALGERPQEYQRMMESLLEDLQPRRGLESHLAEQMGETFWRMRRAQRTRDGLALKNIRRKVQTEDMMAAQEAAKALEALEPFERLKEALSRRGEGIMPEEIDEFVKTQKGDSSQEMREFITLLKLLKEPMEEQERKEARREARKQLPPLMQPYLNAAWHFGRKVQRVQSSENLAALMALEDKDAAHLQRLEDSYLHRMWRLINAFGKVRQGMLQKKI